jgi:hypothetical protein
MKKPKAKKSSAIVAQKIKNKPLCDMRILVAARSRESANTDDGTGLIEDEDGDGNSD